MLTDWTWREVFDSDENVVGTQINIDGVQHTVTGVMPKEAGGNAFLEYSVPEAILKLRQGVGRLIRSRRDRGITVILDNRVLTKTYGKAFLRALPPAPVKIVDDTYLARP